MGHMVRVCFTSQETVRLLSKVVGTFCCLPLMDEISGCFGSLWALSFFVHYHTLKILVNLIDAWDHSMVLKGISLISNGIKLFFHAQTCHLCIFSDEVSVQVYVHYFIVYLLFLFSYYWVFRVLSIFWTHVLYWIAV